MLATMSTVDWLSSSIQLGGTAPCKEDEAKENAYESTSSRKCCRKVGEV